MPSSRRSLQKGLLVCLLIGAALGGLFGLALFVTAVSGENFASNMLLGGIGLLLLLLSAFAFVFVIEYGKSSKHGEDD